MNPVNSALVDYAVLWTVSSKNDYGVETLTAPTQIRCKFQKTDSEQRSSNSANVAKSTTAVVEQDIPIGAFLWFGKLVDLPVGGIPVSDIFQVADFVRTNNIKGNATFRSVSLIRHNDRLPPLA